jgi:RimJ/RimL family protein N-acetyltransferase
VDDGDLDAYYRIYCDPAMMTELGGAVPREGIPEKLRKHVALTVGDERWVSMIVPDGSGTVAGMVTIDRREHGLAEIGWAVLVDFQGQGVGKTAVRLMLERAARDGRWGVLHAFPGVDNGPSNGICRTLGFSLVGQQDSTFEGRTLRSNHWLIEPPNYGTLATAT